MSLLQDGLGWLASRLKESAGRAVTYTRGQFSVPVTPWLIETRSEDVGADGLVLERHDILRVTMAAADLVLNGSVVLPERGDRLAVVRGTTTHRYEVMGGGIEPPYVWEDSEHTMLTVQARQIERRYA